MVDWKHLWMAASCAAISIGGSIVLAQFFPNVLLVLIAVAFVCALTFSFYMILDSW